MSLDLFDILGEAFEKIISRTGLIFIGLLLVLNFLSRIPAEGFANLMVNNNFSSISSIFNLILAPTFLFISFLIFVGTIIISIAAVRNFVSDEDKRIRKEFFTRNMFFAGVNSFIGAIFYGIIIGVGFILFIIPGIFLLVSLFAWEIFVVVEDQNFLEAGKSSWNLTEGNRLPLAGLLLLVTVIGIIVNIPVQLFDRGVSVLIVEPITGSILTVFVLAVSAVAYNRLSDLEDKEEVLDG